jgi:hypothetical protein
MVADRAVGARTYSGRALASLAHCREPHLQLCGHTSGQLGGTLAEPRQDRRDTVVVEHADAGQHLDHGGDCESSTA